MKRDIRQKLRHIPPFAGGGDIITDYWDRLRLRLLFAQLSRRIRDNQNQLKADYRRRENVRRKLEAIENHALPFAEVQP
jgi:hypothetical protein